MYSFTSKADTLAYLYDKQAEIGASVLPLRIFTVREWMSSREMVWAEVKNTFKTAARFIVRSSAQSEDSLEESNAGKYRSEFCEANEKSFFAAVQEVINSYEQIDDSDIFFVQSALEIVECAGVAFTIDPNTGGQYYVINYDDVSGSTYSVTSGQGEQLKLYYRYKEDSFLGGGGTPVWMFFAMH